MKGDKGIAGIEGSVGVPGPYGPRGKLFFESHCCFILQIKLSFIVYIPYCTKKSSHNTQNNKQKI
jgi:hypothetical protein